MGWEKIDQCAWAHSEEYVDLWGKKCGVVCGWFDDSTREWLDMNDNPIKPTHCRKRPEPPKEGS